MENVHLMNIYQGCYSLTHSFNSKNIDWGPSMHRLEGNEIAKVSQTDQKEKSLPSWSLFSQRRRQSITKQIHKIYSVLDTKKQRKTKWEEHFGLSLKEEVAQDIMKAKDRESKKPVSYFKYCQKVIKRPKGDHYD